MPYVDENGTIMIDEVAANEDIGKLNVAKAGLEEAVALINQISVINGEFAGPTATAIEEAVASLKGNMQLQIENIDICLRNIQTTVCKYQEVDASLKDTINSQMS